MQINTSFYKLALSFLMEVARLVQNTQNRKLVIFLQCIETIVWQLCFFSIVMQNIQIFYGDPVIFVVSFHIYTKVDVHVFSYSMLFSCCICLAIFVLYT